MFFDYECRDCESTSCRCEMPEHEAYPHLYKEDPITGRSILRLEDISKKEKSKKEK